MKKLFLLSILFVLSCMQWVWANIKEQQKIRDNSEIAVNAERNATRTIYKSEAYRELEQKAEIARRNAAKLPGNPDFMKELQQAEQNLESFKSEITRLHEEINKIPLNSERGANAKQFFEDGDFKAAQKILDVKEMSREQNSKLYTIDGNSLRNNKKLSPLSSIT